MVKLLRFEGDGMAIYFKRLEEGTFQLPGGESAEISRGKLALILEGIELSSVKKRKRFCLERPGIAGQV